MQSVWYYEETSPISFLERIVPGGEISLLINLDEDDQRYYDSEDLSAVVHLPAVAVHGLHTRAFLIDTVEQRRIAGVVLGPGGAFPFFDLLISELHNLHLGAGELWGDTATGLRERCSKKPAAEPSCGSWCQRCANC